MTPGFSERTFEFCFNAEYCQTNKAILATHPHIPTQRAEKDLGYDVEFVIKSGGYNKSLFLQHKVVSHAEVRAGRNAKFYAAHKKPYFRFPVDKHQHNVLCDLSATRGDAFYCAPKFHLRNELETHFWATAVAQNSVLINPSDVGRISDSDHHNVTYDKLGNNPTLHSEPRRFQRTYSGGKEDGPPLHEREISEEYIEQFAAELRDRADDTGIDRMAMKAIRAVQPTEQIQVILGRVYQVTWLLLPKNEA